MQCDKCGRATTPEASVLRAGNWYCRRASCAGTKDRFVSNVDPFTAFVKKLKKLMNKTKTQD